MRDARTALGLTQAQIAKLAGLSRTTISHLESGNLPDLGYLKLVNLLSVLGLNLELKPAKGVGKALDIAARTVSTSYHAILGPAQLAQILASGTAPLEYHAHIITFLDETPLPVAVKAIHETSIRVNISIRAVMRNVSQLAKDLHIRREVW